MHEKQVGFLIKHVTVQNCNLYTILAQSPQHGIDCKSLNGRVPKMRPFNLLLQWHGSALFFWKLMIGPKNPNWLKI